MRRRLLVVGLVVGLVAMLTGCALLDQIIGGITGGGPGGGTTMPEYPISGRMKFNLDATVWRDDGYTGKSSYAGSVGTTFWSGVGSYYDHSRSFNAHIWDGGDFSGTAFIAGFSQDEKTIESFVANQTQANVWVAYTYYHFIRGVNVPFSHIDGNSRYYRIEGTAARAAHLTELEFSMWVPGSEKAGSLEDPLEWITGGPTAATGNVDDYIEIRLDYENTATSPFD